ncbi:MAG: CPBP family intramembrane glutamic endopeptidase [Kiritimatiellia bacterium]
MKKSLAIIALLVWPLYLNDFYLAVLDNSQLGLLWTLDLVFYFVIPSVTLLILHRKKVFSLSDFGLVEKPRWRQLWAAFGLCVVFIVLMEWNLRPWLRQTFPWQLFAGYPFPHEQPLRGITIIYAALTAGILEEIVYRGVVTTQLEKHIHSHATVLLLSCLIFAGCHWGRGPAKLLEAFILAIPLTWWFMKKRSLWGPIACHILYNLLIFTELV